MKGEQEPGTHVGDARSGQNEGEVQPPHKGDVAGAQCVGEREWVELELEE